MSNGIESLSIQFAGVRGKGRIPSWARLWNVSSTTLEEIRATEIKPGIVVIQSRAPADLMRRGHNLPSWSQATAATNPYVVVAFARYHKWSASKLAEILRLFPGAPQVEFANGMAQLRESLTESMAKYLVYGGKTRSEPRQTEPKTATDALGEAREVIAAVGPLLASSGRLSAPKVAALFGMSTAKLGRLIGSSRQALGKTPDAPAIQGGLRPFERIARLRAILSESDFRAWLNRANHHLDDHPPIQLIESGRAPAVANLVEDMLTGAPS